MQVGLGRELTLGRVMRSRAVGKQLLRSHARNMGQATTCTRAAARPATPDTPCMARAPLAPEHVVHEHLSTPCMASAPPAPEHVLHE